MDLPWPSAGGAPAESQPRRYPLGDGGNLWVYDVGLACCAVEFVAASVRHEFAAAGYSPYPAALRDAQILVVSGTVTDKIAPEVVRAYAEVPDPKYVISFGSCANSGGPYWDSYSVTKGVDQLIPVDVYVPGCPPRPESLLDGLKKLNTMAAR